MEPDFSRAFRDDPILSRVREAYHSNPEIQPLLLDINTYVGELVDERNQYLHEVRILREQIINDAEPAAKKRKLSPSTSTFQPTNAQQQAPSAAVAAVNGATAEWRQYDVAFEAPDISFALPMRKKLTLQIVNGPAGSPGDGGVKVKAAADADDVFMPWRDVDQVLCVPVPEKAQPTYQFIVMPTPSSSRSPIMWTMPAAVPKAAPRLTSALEAPAAADTTLDALTLRVLDSHLAALAKRTIVPDRAEFVSALAQPHRKAEPAYHVKAFRGSKDGFLYLLPGGILFAPRAPLLFFPLHAVVSISYSSVLQRTFNLNVCARVGGAGADDAAAETEFEFAMLDQADFAGIDAYVRRHGLHDASLAAHRRAKVYGVNAPKGAAAANGAADGAGAAAPGAGVGAAPVNGGEAGAEGESELARAERALQDAEDDEEEDYEASGGESDGSGTESEEEEGEEGGGREGEHEDEDGGDEEGGEGEADEL